MVGIIGSENSVQGSSMDRSTNIHCPACGAFLGKIMPGYVKVVQCYCGELIPINKPSQKELEEDTVKGQELG